MLIPDFLHRTPDAWVHFPGHRVGLENVVYLYNQGYSPEMLASEFPSIPLADIHKTIAYYLENRSDVDEYIESCKSEIKKQCDAPQLTPSLDELRQRAEAARSVESA